jgi:hypothetical protein|tara:strand:- start:8275 stop:8463 length:189 start_codon:yes stop_codon:yes gene_type:complete
MARHRDPDWLLGRRFVCDFRVLSVDGDAARTVTLLLNGDRYKISHEELMTIIERGLVMEAPR